MAWLHGVATRLGWVIKAAESDDEGHWITIRHGSMTTHIFIDHTGMVTKGPRRLVGANIAHLPPVPRTYYNVGRQYEHLESGKVPLEFDQGLAYHEHPAPPPMAQHESNSAWENYADDIHDYRKAQEHLGYMQRSGRLSPEMIQQFQQGMISGAIQPKELSEHVAQINRAHSAIRAAHVPNGAISSEDAASMTQAMATGEHPDTIHAHLGSMVGQHLARQFQRQISEGSMHPSRLEEEKRQLADPQYHAPTTSAMQLRDIIHQRLQEALSRGQITPDEEGHLRQELQQTPTDMNLSDLQDKLATTVERHQLKQKADKFQERLHNSQAAYHNMDPLTHSLFGQRSYDVRMYGHNDQQRLASLTTRMFGGAVDGNDLARMCGMPDDTRVQISVGNDDIYLRGRHDDLGLTIHRSINFHDEDGVVTVHNDLMEFDGSGEHGGVGSRVFAQQVHHSREMGIVSLHTNAHRDDYQNPPYIGYKVWPKMGYNAPIPEEFRREAEYEGHTDIGETLLDIYSDPDLRDLWADAGESIDVDFDLDPESLSSLWHNNYVQQRNIKVGSI